MARSGSARPFDAATQQIGVIDRRALEIELDLSARAEEQGKANMPPPEQRDKDSLAMDIDTYLAQVAREVREELKAYMASLRRSDNTARPWDVHITKRDAAFKAALNELFETAKNGVNELFEQREQLADITHAFQEFRTEQNINRPPDHATNPWHALAWLGCILVGEAIFNAFALGGAHPQGFVGVLPETLGIAFVNVLFLGGLLGYGARIFSRSESGAHAVGGVIVLAVIAVAVMFNFLIAHYRDMLLSSQAAGDIDNYIAAYASMFRDTLTKAFSSQWYILDGMMSFLMLPVGFGLCIFAARKWYYMEDVHPRYSRLARAREECVREYADIARDEYAKIGRIAGEATRRISGMHEMAVAALSSVEEHETTCRDLCEQYTAWISGVNELGQALYARYREINMQHREKSIMPKAFELPFDLPVELVNPLESPVQNAPVTEEQIIVQRTRVEAQNALVATAQNRYLEIYMTIGQLAPDATVTRGVPFDNDVATVNTELQAEAKKIA